MKSMNMNEYVYVQLTEVGLNVLESNIPKSLPVDVKEGIRNLWKPNEDGWTKFQLWELFQEFGSSMYNGAPTYFKDNEIRFDERKMKIV